MTVSKKQRSQAYLCVVGGFAVQFCIGLILVPRAVAQASSTDNSTQVQWDVLKKADSRITACRVSWKKVMRRNPNPQADPEKRATHTLEWARQQGFTEKQAQQQATVERREAERSLKGQTLTSFLDFVRVGKSVRCDIKEPEYGHSSVEFSNGIDSLFAPIQVNGQEAPKNANLTRDEKRVLLLSAGGEQVARFLLGIPLQENFGASNPSFNPDNSTLTALPNGDIRLEHKSGYDLRSSASPDEMIVPKNSGRPSAYNVFGIDLLISKEGAVKRKSNKLSESVRIEDYREYRGGVWFPSKVTFTTSNSTTEYTLSKAAFNEDVDPIEVRLPSGIRVADARFGYGDKLAIYNLRSGQIPSDTEVKAMLEKPSAKSKDKASTKTETTTPAKGLPPLPLTPALGLLLIAISGALWPRSSKGKDS